MFLPGPVPGEQRKKDGFGSRLQLSDVLPYGGELLSRCRLQTRGVHFQEGEGKRGIIVYWKKGGTPPYIGQGGGASSSPPPCGTKHPRGECAGLGGCGPLPWRQSKGGGTPLLP